MSPLISIGLVSFNRPKDLRRALASCVGQSYPNLEILVTDSSTHPEVAGVLAEYEQLDTRVRVFRHSKDPGVFGSFNFVLQQSGGEFFMWLADDDWLAPEGIALLSAALIRNPAAVEANGAVSFYKGDELDSTEPPHQIFGASASARVISYCRTLTHNSIIFGLHRKANLRGLILGNELAHDWIFMAKVVARGPVATVPQLTLLRSLGGTSESVDKIIQVRKLSQPSPVNLYRKYAADLFGGLLRDRRQLPELGAARIFWIALLAGGIFWYRGTVSGPTRAKLKSWFARFHSSPPS